jgi:multisubunit Na+/H+ antiporter MnhB subunit
VSYTLGMDNDQVSAVRFEAPYQYRETKLLPALGALLLTSGCVLSALLAFIWPLSRDGNSVVLSFVEIGETGDGTVFNVPLFLLGAMPSIIGGCILIAAGSIVDELRRVRASQS